MHERHAPDHQIYRCIHAACYALSYTVPAMFCEDAYPAQATGKWEHRGGFLRGQVGWGERGGKGSR